MASLFQQKTSRFWWIKFRDSTGKVVRRATAYEHNDRRQTRQAEIFRAKKEVEELSAGRGRSDKSMQWDHWVHDFLQQRHAASPKTLRRKMTVWRTLRRYLAEKQLLTPTQVTRQDCLAYLNWRKEQRSFKSKRQSVSHNTVLLELKVLQSILQEPVRRGWCIGNACSRLEIAKETPKERQEMTDEHIAIIRSALQRRREREDQSEDERQNTEFLRISFEIAVAQGCRMSETHINLDDVDLKNLELTMLAKGRKRYTAPLNPALVPMFKAMKDAGQQWTYQPPPIPSLIWFKFLDRIRKKYPSMKRVSFHSTRVAVASRLGRGGVPERVAMAILNHASTTIHRIYRRVHPSEVAGAWAALSSNRLNETPGYLPTTEGPISPSSASHE